MPQTWPVIVVGAGPVGLTLAIDLAQRGVDVLLLDEDGTVSIGSRAICWARRTLEIFDRLGCGEAIAAKGVRWNRGRVFFGDDQVYDFELAADAGHRRPAFVNLQQYWVEQILVERLQQLPRAQLRWHHKVIDVARDDEGAMVEIATPDGRYSLRTKWLVAADGAKSSIRRMLGLERSGQVFRDRFLIADVHMTSTFPAERWFWFDPPFHRNQSALLHRQADDVWRIDFQLGWDADPVEECKPANIDRRLRAMLGDTARFEIEWSSVYTFACRRMQSFVHDRIIFAGDAAHVVSPFGARGANSGIQDADNLAWKLWLVLTGNAHFSVIATYDAERTQAADDNIAHSTRSTDFITPKSAMSRIFRDAVLTLAKRYPFARPLVNSGRLSLPTVHHDSPLNTPEVDDFSAALSIGAVAVDAPVHGPAGQWLLQHLTDGFTLLMFDVKPTGSVRNQLAVADPPCAILQVDSAARKGEMALQDVEGLIARRYDARPGTCYLFRPDHHVCARWRSFDVANVTAAMQRAIGHQMAVADKAGSRKAMA